MIWVEKQKYRLPDGGECEVICLCVDNPQERNKDIEAEFVRLIKETNPIVTGSYSRKVLRAAGLSGWRTLSSIPGARKVE
jgi:hypothetical protein